MRRERKYTYLVQITQLGFGSGSWLFPMVPLNNHHSIAGILLPQHYPILLKAHRQSWRAQCARICPLFLNIMKLCSIILTQSALQNRLNSIVIVLIFLPCATQILFLFQLHISPCANMYIKECISLESKHINIYAELFYK